MLMNAAARSLTLLLVLGALGGAARAQPLYFGAFTYGGVWQGMDAVHALERDLGRQLDIVHWFMNWDHAWDARLVASAARGGRFPMISWQPHRQPLDLIAAGRYDAYIRTWAQGARAHGGAIYLRLFPEMNGDWVAWHGDPETFTRAWRRVVSLFQLEGADNVRFVWSPNVTDQPRTPENRMEAYYPGHDYVDVLALDGYNWGTARPWSAWRSFEDIFSEPYARIAALGHQPIWLAEIASAEDGGDKGAWVRDMLTSRAFPRIQAVVWFDENKETDWRIGSSAESLAAFQEALVDSQLAAR
jgi:hypothetical protein